jgi:hypothetical protein
VNMTKLPEPSGYLFDPDTTYYTEAAYTKEQMLQFRQDALENVMKELLWIRQWMRKDEANDGVVISNAVGSQWSKWIDRVDAIKEAMKGAA